MKATSPALNEPTRSLEQAKADHYMRRLDDLASRFEMMRDRIRNSSGGADIEQQAGRAADDAHAIRWALGKIRAADYQDKMLADITRSLKCVGPSGIDA